MNLRAFRPGEDEEAVISLWHACGLVVAHNDPNKDIARKLKVNAEWFLVGEIDGAVMASCMVGHDGHRGWINYLAVHPEYQRRGYASQVMAEAERLQRAAGCPKINLQVRESNTVVIDFYESAGFAKDAVLSMGKRLESDPLEEVE
jgi:ribosomal protein S18 acetylase RimI-like enzyme